MFQTYVPFQAKIVISKVCKVTNIKKWRDELCIQYWPQDGPLYGTQVIVEQLFVQFSIASYASIQPPEAWVLNIKSFFGTVQKTVREKI